jgi:hypothetical protein
MSRTNCTRLWAAPHPGGFAAAAVAAGSTAAVRVYSTLTPASCFGRAVHVGLLG